jgi:hypothetical protein
MNEVWRVDDQLIVEDGDGALFALDEQRTALLDVLNPILGVVRVLHA